MRKSTTDGTCATRKDTRARCVIQRNRNAPLEKQTKKPSVRRVKFFEIFAVLRSSKPQADRQLETLVFPFVLVVDVVEVIQADDVAAVQFQFAQAYLRSA